MLDNVIKKVANTVSDKYTLSATVVKIAYNRETLPLMETMREKHLHTLQLSGIIL